MREEGELMTNRVLVAILCGLLLIYLPVMPPTAEATTVLGQMTVRGQAKINGIVTASGATLFGGDQVATDKEAIAQLLLTGGSRVLLPESSAVILTSSVADMMVNLKQGGLAMVNGSGLPAFIEANGALIKPTGRTTVLEAVVVGNSLKVLVHRGSATVETADKNLEVAEGKELDATMLPAPVPQGPAGTRAAGRGRLETYVFITAVAAGLTGLVLGIVAVSRANPADCRVVSPSGTIKCP